MSRRLLLALGGVLVISIGGMLVWLNGDDGREKTLLTINLGGTILRQGGTVIVLPTPIPDETPKPGRSHSEAVQRELTADVTEPLSIVFFDYPEAGKWTFRFDTRSSDPEAQRVTTLLLEFGSGSYRDASTEQMIEVPDIQTLMVSGPNADEGVSRLHGVHLFDYLRAPELECRNFDDARVCVPK
ncbi:MAG: hypothetical protein ABW026_00635 [Microvirga sp.]